jgi:hypothetical protein
LVFIKEMKLLGEVLLPDARVSSVPSGTMLQVIVAGSPFPDRGPDAVKSHGSGSVELRMNPDAGAADKASNGRAIARIVRRRHMML